MIYPPFEKFRLWLIRNLAGMGDSGVLGYPLWIYTRFDSGDDSTPFVKPVFTYLLDYELEGDGLSVSSADPVLLSDANRDFN